MSKPVTAQHIQNLTATGLLLALAVALNFFEGLLPALPALPPGVKLGLSNIVVVYCLCFLGKRQGLTIALLKSGFVFLTRGASAGFISLCGGMFSVGILMFLLAGRNSEVAGKQFFLLGIGGAVAHNLGQLFAASLYMKTAAVFYYFPVLLLSGCLMGTATAALMKATLPALKRISVNRN